MCGLHTYYIPILLHCLSSLPHRKDSVNLLGISIAQWRELYCVALLVLPTPDTAGHCTLNLIPALRPNTLGVYVVTVCNLAVSRMLEVTLCNLLRHRCKSITEVLTLVVSQLYLLHTKRSFVSCTYLSVNRTLRSEAYRGLAVHVIRGQANLASSYV